MDIMAAGVGLGAAGSSPAPRMDIAGQGMRDAVLQIINSPHFVTSEIRERTDRLTISQAYCLLWQNAETGNVSGRQTWYELMAGASACCLLDLIVLGKITLDVVPKSTLGFKYENVYLKVVHETPTGTYLDQTIFDRILERHHKQFDDPRKMKTWIVKDMNQYKPKDRCAAITLDSLVDKGVLKKDEHTFSIDYPTVDPAPEQHLVQEIQKIGLHGTEPDSYMRALLTMLLAVDSLHCLWDVPLLKKCFPKDQYDEAKERIKAMVKVNKSGKERCNELMSS